VQVSVVLAVLQVLVVMASVASDKTCCIRWRACRRKSGWRCRGSRSRRRRQRSSHCRRDMGVGHCMFCNCPVEMVAVALEASGKGRKCRRSRRRRSRGGRSRSRRRMHREYCLGMLGIRSEV
jgi:hypothetical protein